MAGRQADAESVTAGWSSASFCWIASAARNSASASAGLPVFDSRMPRELWLSASAAAEVGDGGVVVGQLLRIASAVRYSASASAGLPVSDSSLPRLRGWPPGCRGSR